MTIRFAVSNDSGITRLPISQLGDADFKKYGLNKDRSKDGRLWYERKEALGKFTERIIRSAKDSKSNGSSLVEIRLGEIAAFQPVISAYEKTLGSKKSEKSAAGSTNPDEKTERIRHAFHPNVFAAGNGRFALPSHLLGLAVRLFSRFPGQHRVRPAVIQSATGAASLPTAPP